MARLYYYYHHLLRRSVHRSFRYSAIASQFTQTLSLSKWKGHSLHRSVILLSISCIFLFQSVQAKSLHDSLLFFPANHPFIQYTGRIDFTNPKLPRFWQPGVYITAKFGGETCEMILNDEILWGTKHNYLEIVVDGKAVRLQTKTKHDTISVAKNLSAGIHTLVICKNTEANIGYMELVGIRCKQLVKPALKPLRKIEFIGNSITCGTGSDLSMIPCGKGVWEDQHNAYMSYGPVTARALNAQYHLSAVSGIGLMHSCCNMNIIMPQVYETVSMRNDTIAWGLSKYWPDVITVCLGQNDGVQDSATFCDNYISFLYQLRDYYPNATIICLSSPAADAKLRAVMEKNLTAIVNAENKNGDKKVYKYFFSKQFHNGCDGHPDLAEHKLIAKELIGAIKKIKSW